MAKTDRPRRGAILFEDDVPAATEAAVRRVDPATAAPVPDEAGAPAPSGRAMQTVALLAARREAGLGRWVLGTLGALLAFAVSLAAWEFVAGLLAANPVLGWIALALVAAFVLACLAVALREVTALARLGRIDDLRRAAEDVRDLAQARAVTDAVTRFYAGRPDTRWGREALARRRDEVMDAADLMAEVERQIIAPLDAAATREVEAAARQVALVTAVVPLALADVAAALVSNLRMIRRIALIYGGRGGTLGSWRLARGVLTHLAATGAVAVGDDMIQSVAGGGVLARVSRRFGEGIVNGALTARVGLAAMEVCRPLPFAAEKPPRVTSVIQRALTGLFGQKD